MKKHLAWLWPLVVAIACFFGGMTVGGMIHSCHCGGSDPPAALEGE